MNRTRIIIGIAIAAAAAGIALSAAYPSAPRIEDHPNNNNTVLPPAPNGSAAGNGAFRAIADSDPPQVKDPALKVEKVIEGLNLPTSMAFLDRDDIIILQKDGTVRLVSNGTMLEEPLLSVTVQSQSERGLLGVAVSNGTLDRDVFLYYTEEDGGEVRNRIYRYNLTGSTLSGGTMILDLPGTPGPNHDGGKLKIGPDGSLYAVIGDLNRDGVLQNFPDGPEPDDTSVILRIDRDGKAVNGTLPADERYYAYGIRNSFGLDFDPVTGTLWDTENGPDRYDEINVVKPGFNSGWQTVMGPIGRTDVQEGDLVHLDGSHYADPVFSWLDSRGLTDIEFLNSSRLGSQYANNIFVGNVNNGNLYYFEINDSRDGISLDGIDAEARSHIEDLVADHNSEMDPVVFGMDFGGITDIETGPDGYLYMLSIDGSVYRIVPGP
jgi:glucose/arabinose dehydrogenase